MQRKIWQTNNIFEIKSSEWRLNFWRFRHYIYPMHSKLEHKISKKWEINDLNLGTKLKIGLKWAQSLETIWLISIESDRRYSFIVWKNCNCILFRNHFWHSNRDQLRMMVAGRFKPDEYFEGMSFREIIFKLKLK